MTLADIPAAERDVLVQLGAGATSRQIAERLGISPWSVKDRLTSLYKRLGVANRHQAAMWYVRYCWRREQAA